jgi:hypothetical protein
MKTLILSALCAAFLIVPQEPQPDAPAGRPGHPATIFFAVLEGLYDEGVATADVDVLLAKDAVTGQFRYFVPGCPLCNPAIDALQLYRSRPRFHGLKEDVDTFGSGLPAKEREALRGEEVPARLRVLHDFIERCIKRKLASLRLTKDERDLWQRVLREMREKGGALLKSAQQQGTAGVLGDAKGCAVCDGMNDAGTWMGR